MKTRNQTVVLLVGICLCAICTFYPPRRFVEASSYEFVVDGASGNTNLAFDVPHAFLFAPNFAIFTRHSAPPSSALLRYPVEIDRGLLLAELLL